MKIASSPSVPSVDCLFVLDCSHSSLPKDLKAHCTKTDFDQVIQMTGKKGPKVLHVLALPDAKKDPHTRSLFRNKGAAIIKAAKKRKQKKIAVCMDGVPEKFVDAFLEGLIISDYKFDQFMTKKDERITELTLVGKGKYDTKGHEKTAEAVHFVRDLVNTPAGSMLPEDLAAAAKVAGKGASINVSIMKESQLKKKGFHALCAVGHASDSDAHLAIMHYKSKGAKKTVALVGKGVTFDTGGLNLKIGSGISDMKFDMAGAATVMGVMKRIASEKLPFNVVGITPIAENMVAGSALHPGDVIDTYSGQTVEVTNTDAEGRLILCDALAYTEKEFKPDLIIDFATLTGACIVALGNEISAVLGNNQWLVDELKKASKQTDEKIWQLPLDERLRKKVKGEISDLKNYTPGAKAGTIMGAAYLSYFIQNTPWAHFDIAGSAWSHDNRGFISKGATGQNVRLIWQFLQNLSTKKEWK